MLNDCNKYGVLILDTQLVGNNDDWLAEGQGPARISEVLIVKRRVAIGKQPLPYLGSGSENLISDLGKGFPDPLPGDRINEREQQMMIGW